MPISSAGRRDLATDHLPAGAASGSATLPHVVVLATGGTISSVPGGQGEGVAPSLTGADLLAELPDLTDVARIDARQLLQTMSYNLSRTDLLTTARAVVEAVAAGADGVVLTQGTDTIEETSFLLSLVLDRTTTCVVTGAMRNPALPGADGPANLDAAVRLIAARPGLGPVVCFNDEIHDPWVVRKSNTSNPATFTSGPGAGPLGWVVEERVRIIHRPVERPTLPLPTAPPPPIAVLAAPVGDDLRLLRHVEDAGYAGVVVDGLGGGHLPERALELLTAVAARIPVVIASRTGSGDVLRSTYRAPGAEIDLISRGLLPAGYLSAPKARLLLAMLLACGEQPRSAWPRFTG
jgi:L-asparaginase